jgi:signal peptidase II
MRGIIVFLFVLVGTFLIDQGIKTWAVDTAYMIAQEKPNYQVPITEEMLHGTTLVAGKCIDMQLHFNKGVAFSLFAFLGPYMKWVQGSLVLLLLFIIFKENYIARYAFPAGLLIGGAIGNVYDRFVHIGVVDYVAWHCGFNYAVFNYADVAIDVAFVLIIIMVFIIPEKSKG